MTQYVANMHLIFNPNEKMPSFDRFGELVCMLGSNQKKYMEFDLDMLC